MTEPTQSLRRRALLASAAALASPLVLPARAQGQVSDGVVKIGVLNDMSGTFSDQQGMGDVVSARMAVEDFGGRVLGAPIEVIFGDLQNRADVGMAVARRWYDQEKVDMILGLGNSAVALAVQPLTQERNRLSIAISAGTTDLTGKACTPVSLHWTYDNYAMARGTVTALAQENKKKWFFITSDYAFGHSLEANGIAMVRTLGGEVMGTVRAPLNETDFSTYILRAASSGANVIGLSVAGNDLINCVKQMGEFGVMRRGITPAALLCLLTNVRAIGSQTAQGLVFTEAYYWDQNDETRAFSQRFARIHGRPPTMFQASSWGAVTHYLKAIQAAGTDAAPAVMAKMRETPINDFMTKNGRIREDGRIIRDMYLMRAKAPAQVKSEWDLLEVVQTIPGDQAFRPLAESECPLVRR